MPAPSLWEWASSRTNHFAPEGKVIQRLVYHLYARHLQAGVLRGLLPEHVAVVLDGNRRFAEGMGSPSVASGYEQGARKVSELLTWCQPLRIPQVTLWVLSSDNLRRPAQQVHSLFQVIQNEIVHIAQQQHQSPSPRQIRPFGQLDLLPSALQEALAHARDITASFNNYFLNVAIAYGGRQEIVHAVQGMLQQYGQEGLSLQDAVHRVNADEIGSHLYLHGIPDPDLIIRTSGEVRLSGFLLWQSVYSEFYFCDAYWPTFRLIDFLRAIRSFQQRKRRYGR